MRILTEEPRYRSLSKPSLHAENFADIGRLMLYFHTALSGIYAHLPPHARTDLSPLPRADHPSHQMPFGQMKLNAFS